MTIADEETLCPDCGRALFPSFMVATEEPKLSCGHVVAMWVWPCTCGAYISQRPERCPFCVGLRPPNG
jgi:hypothetical protein